MLKNSLRNSRECFSNRGRSNTFEIPRSSCAKPGPSIRFFARFPFFPDGGSSKAVGSNQRSSVRSEGGRFGDRPAFRLGRKLPVGPVCENKSKPYPLFAWKM